MKIMTKKFRSPDQAKLKIVCDELCDNIEQLLDNFDIEYKVNPKMISMSCPIHGGDNPSAINIYPDGDTYRGNWKCRTHNCEQEFKASIIGFIRGVISSQKYGWKEPGDNGCSFQEALDYAMAFLNKDLKSIKISKSDRDKKSFTNIVNYINPKTNEDNIPRVSRQQIIKAINIPADYYLSRNYSKEVLVKYDVGLCSNSSKPMFNRVVVPIYDNDYTFMVGCTGRSVFEKCECGCFHNPKDTCPSAENKWLYSKWKHSADFKSQNYLYNFWFAKTNILKTSTAIIVESPGNVWRLEENGIHNSVAIFGSSLSDRQKILLDSSGAMNLIILTDNDDAGRKAAEQIKSKCQNTYRVFVPPISKNDVGEMTPEEINVEIKQYIERVL